MASRMPELADRLGFDLADALAGDGRASDRPLRAYGRPARRCRSACAAPALRAARAWRACARSARGDGRSRRPRRATIVRGSATRSPSRPSPSSPRAFRAISAPGRSVLPVAGGRSAATASRRARPRSARVPSPAPVRRRARMTRFIASTICTGYANGAGLIGDRPIDGLADPPGGIGREAIPPPVVELLDRPHQADVALLDEIEERQAALHVAPAMLTTSRRLASMSCVLACSAR